MFVVYIAFPKVPILIMMIYLTKEILLAALAQDKTLIEISIKYSDFVNVFSTDLAIMLNDCLRINEHAIKLFECKRPLYSLSYSPSSMELET